MLKIDVLLSLLQKIQPKGKNRWVARCPAHGDKTPSLSVRLLDDDKILIHCFGGCSIDEVVSSIGLTLADLMPNNPDYSKPTKSRIPASDILQFIAFETQIVITSLDKLLSGESLSDVDQKRLLLAHERLQNAAMECCK